MFNQCQSHYEGLGTKVMLSMTKTIAYRPICHKSVAKPLCRMWNKSYVIAKRKKYRTRCHISGLMPLRRNNSCVIALTTNAYKPMCHTCMSNNYWGHGSYILLTISLTYFSKYMTVLKYTQYLKSAEFST